MPRRGHGGKKAKEKKPEFLRYLISRGNPTPKSRNDTALGVEPSVHGPRIRTLAARRANAPVTVTSFLGVPPSPRAVRRSGRARRLARSLCHGVCCLEVAFKYFCWGFVQRETGEKTHLSGCPIYVNCGRPLEDPADQRWFPMEKDNSPLT